VRRFQDTKLTRLGGQVWRIGDGGEAGAGVGGEGGESAGGLEMAHEVDEVQEDENIQSGKNDERREARAIAERS